MSNITDKVVVITGEPAVALGQAPRSFSQNEEQKLY
jgi:hypothetical protein